MTERRLLISFSGGETSAYMTRWILQNWQDRYDRIVVAFANTGQEREECLEFVHRCDQEFGFNVVWLEAVIHHGERRGPTHRVVSYETASREGEPFEEFIRKYGIPNTKFPACTRALKRYPIMDYAKSIGWPTNSYDTAIGIRADETSRMTEDKHLKRVVYPLATELPTTKPQVNYYWHRQPFRLGLKGYQGNCKWCWKKSFRKLLTIRDETPEAFEFPRRMEEQYGLIGAEFTKDNLADGYRRTFFRENKGVADLAQLAAERGPDWQPADDDAQTWEFNFDFDWTGECGESCEPWTMGVDEIFQWDNLEPFEEAAA